MANNIVGFMGIENYEIIMYVSRILNNLGKKVLMVDYSETGSLAACVPVPVGLNAKDDIIDFRRTDFTMKIISSDILNEYDDILINFGFNVSDDILDACNHLVFITDQQKQNIENIAALPKVEINDTRKQMVIKDSVESKINQAYILKELKNVVFDDNVYVLDQDENNTISKLLVQYDVKFGFRKVSKALKNYLKDTVKSLYTELSDKELNRAYKLAEGGN